MPATETGSLDAANLRVQQEADGTLTLTLDGARIDGVTALEFAGTWREGQAFETRVTFTRRAVQAPVLDLVPMPEDLVQEDR